MNGSQSLYVVILKLDVVAWNNAVHDGIEGKSRYCFDAELGRDVLAVAEDCVQADVQLIGDLFIRDAFYDQLKYVYLTAG